MYSRSMSPFSMKKISSDGSRWKSRRALGPRTIMAVNWESSQITLLPTGGSKAPRFFSTHSQRPNEISGFMVSSDGQVAAVHDQLGAGDVGGLVGGQEEHGVGDLFHAALNAFSRQAGSADALEVRMGGRMPGCTELTRMPSCAYCTAADLVMRRTA